MDEAKINELFADEAFVVSILKMETPEEVQVALEEKGVSLSLSDINAIKDALASANSEELSDDDLENVAGGGIGSIVNALIKGVSKLIDKVDEWTGNRW